MIPCICGHGHLSGATCHCGCPDYQPEHDAIDDLVDWQINTGRGR